MRAKTIIPTYDELYDSAPQEIKDYIDKCNETPQGTDWHPEGPVGRHNRLVYDRAVQYGDLNLALAAFFHDLGKVDTTAPNKKGGYSAYGHERVSGNLVYRHRQWIGSLGAKFMQVKEIVDNHMKIKQMDKMRPHKQEAMRNLRTYSDLLKFTECDDMRTLTDEELNRYK
jgi:hypothetical protein